MFESDADRLAMIQAVGEQFDTGKPTKLWGVFDNAYLASDLERFSVANAEPMIQVRTSDVALHELVKQSRLIAADGTEYFVKTLEPDGTGMTVLRFS